MTQTNNRTKLSKLGKLFRSLSEQGLKASHQQTPSSAAKTSPNSAPRRRFLRVVRDDASAGEEYENGHLVRRYTKQYWERQMEEARELQHATSLPYDVNSEHGILKRNTSTESDCENGMPSPTSKRAYFKEEIQVIEFCHGESIHKHAFHMHQAKLYDSAEECSTERTDSEHDAEFRKCERGEFKLAKQNSFDEGDEDDLSDTDAAGNSVASAATDSNDISDASSTVNTSSCDSGVVSDQSLVSDSGAQSDTSNCSDCNALSEPKNKRQKKRRLRFRHVTSLLDTSQDSDKENDQLKTDSRHRNKSRVGSVYPKSISRLLRSVHLPRHKEQEHEQSSDGCYEAAAAAGCAVEKSAQ